MKKEATTIPAQQFAERMSRLTDLDLLDLIERADEYQPEAVQVAQQELDSRNIGASRMEYLREQLEKLQEDRAIKEAPLDTGRMVFYFLFPFFIPWMHARQFKAEGFDRKHRVTWRATKFGFMFYLCLIALAKAMWDGAVRFSF